jgi:hypothetical protein
VSLPESKVRDLSAAGMMSATVDADRKATILEDALRDVAPEDVPAARMIAALAEEVIRLSMR